VKQPDPSNAVKARVLLDTASRGLPEPWKAFLAQVAAGTAPEAATADNGQAYDTHGTALFAAICKDKELYLQWAQSA
jgi:hypothetical protein